MRNGRLAGLAAAATLVLAAAPALGATTTTGPAPSLAPGVIAQGVSIGGVDVSGLTRAQARAEVLSSHVARMRRPLLVTFRGRRFAVDPVAAGYRADVDYAVRGALLFGRSRPLPGSGRVDVPLRQTVSPARIRALLAARSARLEVTARDAAVSLSGGKPVVRPARFGYRVDQDAAADLLQRALLSRRFASYALPAERVAPSVTSIGPVIVVNRGEFKLRLYRGEKRVRSYPVAVGQPAYPTPSGSYEVIEMQTNPTWFPPDSPWAAGLGPVPPGVGNPLGTRWIGTSAPGIGMHGTPVPSSIGTRASHGCIRMYIHDAEDLYRRVEVGTPVFIV